MVKNTASMQSLRDSVSQFTISNPSNIDTTGDRRPSPTGTMRDPTQPLVNLNGPMPLHGNNDYTKALMTRIATGEATPEERARWEQHVAAVRSRPASSVHNNAFDQPLMQPSDSQESSFPPMSTEAPEETEEERMTRLAQLHAYQMELMLLEQQNKRRLLAQRQKQDEQTNKSIHPAQKDYESQLLELERQNKKRMEQTRRLQDEVLKPADVNDSHQPSSAARSIHANNTVNPDDVLSTDLTQKIKTRQQQRTEVLQKREAKQATHQNAAEYTEPFCKFLTENPTVFHAVDAVKKQLKDAGFTELSERDRWDIKPSGSYFVERNGSSLIAFTVGGKYEPGNGAAILAGHVDALTAKLKPISKVPNKAGYVQLGVAPYAGAPNTTWWDRDLSIGGRVLVREGNKIATKLVKLDWPIARIPTLAPHFGAAASGPFNPETQMVPIIGLEGAGSHACGPDSAEPFSQPPVINGMDGEIGSFTSTQPPRLVRAIGNALGLGPSSYSDIVNWELELYDTQPAQVGGLDKEFIFAGRVDDKLCSWAAIQALLEAQDDTASSSQIKLVGLFDNEEIGSLLRQGARGNFLPQTMERAVGALAAHTPTSDLMGRTYANSFLVSSDVIHAVNPNFLNAYLENHAPHLNVGVVVSADSNGHMTTDAVSTALFKRCADKVGARLQVFQIRNDSRSGGTVGPMLSSMTGIRAIDAGIPQLSMHSIRATTGSLDPGLGVLCFLGFLNGFEGVDREFRE